ncbi:AP2 domain protein [Streptococcus pneumoniae]|nr:AP2 domain protein [Streptococcus pneumoniae]
MIKTLHEHIGERFGYLVVTDVFRDKRGTKTRTYFTVQCDCGNTKEILAHNVKKNVKSCGCKSNEMKVNIKHGMHDSRIYQTYHDMKQRCLNPKIYCYHRYGGRGITICDEWLESFENFRDWAFSNGYDDTLTIERINNDGNYEPGNCKWETNENQQKNKSSNPNPNRGEDHHGAKLTWGIVREIRGTPLKRGTKRSLARKYNVSPTLISSVINNKIWREQQ